MALPLRFLSGCTIVPYGIGKFAYRHIWMLALFAACRSAPSHGSLRPQDQHVIIYTPASGYKGQDSFTCRCENTTEAAALP